MPVTALPVGRFRWRVTVIIFVVVFVTIVNAHDTAGERQRLAERHQHRLVYLALGVNIQPAVQEHHPEDSQHGRRNQLYVSIVFHVSILFVSPACYAGFHCAFFFFLFYFVCFSGMLCRLFSHPSLGLPPVGV